MAMMVIASVPNYHLIIRNGEQWIPLSNCTVS